MQNLSTGIQRAVESWGPEAQTALKRARNKERYRAAVERAWKARPEIARFVLAHTNGIYVAQDTRPRRGPDRDKPWWVFGIYLDDAMARTEVDARQAALFQCLLIEGFAIDELRFFPAKWDMRQRRLFPELCGEEAPAAPAGDPVRRADEALALDKVKQAVYLVFEDTEQAWALLEKVRGATLREAPPLPDAADVGRPGGPRTGDARYQLHWYVEDPEEVRPVMAAFGRAIRSQARRLGLKLSGIWVHEAPDALAGRHAFKRVGSSVPMGNEGEGAGGAAGPDAAGAPGSETGPSAC